MRIELSQDYLDKHLDTEFAVGCVVIDENNEKIAISKFSGYNEVGDDGLSRDEIVVHFDDGSAMELETFDRAVFVTKTLKPVSPDWFVETVILNGASDDIPEAVKAEQEAEANRETEQRAEWEATAKAEQRLLVSIPARWQQTKALASSLKRPIEDLSDTEIFAKVLGTPLAVAEDVLIAYEGNLKRMASTTPRELGKIKGIGDSRSERLAASFELGKRLARHHAERDKITSPADVADLMMSKLRYLQKEIVVVLALDTKGGVTSTGKRAKHIEDAEALEWGKLVCKPLADPQKVFEGTLNASVFHPREIFRFAIEETANSIIICHNHPSGDPQPSQEDIRATKQLIEAGNQIGIKVLDHIIIGDGIFVSLKEENFI